MSQEYIHKHALCVSRAPIMCLMGGIIMSLKSRKVSHSKWMNNKDVPARTFVVRNSIEEDLWDGVDTSSTSGGTSSTWWMNNEKYSDWLIVYSFTYCQSSPPL